SNVSNTRDRGSSRSPDQRYDTIVYTDKSSAGTVWEIAVPNGTYSVLLVAGDPSSSSATYRYNVEGVLAVSGKASSSKRWISGTVTVPVIDGRLTVSNGTGYKNNRLCFIEITRLP